MIRKSILLVEDEDLTRELMKEMLTSKGYHVTDCPNGKAALETYIAAPVPVVITDIDMPVMDGYELISHLAALEVPPVIFVTTINSEPEIIINIMKKGIYDYILKPVKNIDLIHLQLNRAFEAYNMKRAYEIAQKEKIVRLENSLEWYKFEERVITRDVKSMGANIFESLLTSFNQGSGFGGLVTLMSIMESSAVKEGDFYKIPEELFDMIIDNATAAEKALHVFGNMISIVTEKIVCEKISLSDLHNKISDTIKKMNSKAIIRKHHLLLSDQQEFFKNFYIEINPPYFMKALEEVLVNALKFSSANSDIMVLFLKQDEICTISVINDINVNEKGHKGIPIGYENLVFEPFYRLTKTVNEDYQTLDYGLGLTLAEKIITKNGGTITINNINDYTDIKSGQKTKVDCTIAFNICKK